MKREFEQVEITGLVERHGADVTVLQWRGRWRSGIVVRLSVGLETAEDLIRDLDEALVGA